MGPQMRRADLQAGDGPHPALRGAPHRPAPPEAAPLRRPHRGGRAGGPAPARLPACLAAPPPPARRRRRRAVPAPHHRGDGGGHPALTRQLFVMAAADCTPLHLCLAQKCPRCMCCLFSSVRVSPRVHQSFQMEGKAPVVARSLHVVFLGIVQRAFDCLWFAQSLPTGHWRLANWVGGWDFNENTC